MDIAGCHPDDLRYCIISYGWHNVIWTQSHPDELAPGRISSGWLMANAVCDPVDLRYYPTMSSGWDTDLIPKSFRWLSCWQYLIRMTYGQCRMSSGWLTMLPYVTRMTLRHLNPTSSGWVSSWSYLIRMTFGQCMMSSRWRSWCWYFIRMSYGKFILSSRWHTLPRLSHPDDIPFHLMSSPWMT